MKLFTFFVVLLALSASKAAEEAKKGQKRGIFDGAVPLSSHEFVKSDFNGYGFDGLDLSEHGFGEHETVFSSNSEHGIINHGYEQLDGISTLSHHQPIDLGHQVNKHITITKKVGIPVPKPYPVTVEKKIPVPVPHPVAVPVDKPYPVHVPKPYAVPVEKPVPYLVEKHIPYPVKIPVKIPYKVPFAVPVPKPYPVTVHKRIPVHIPEVVIIKKPVPIFIKSLENDFHSTFNTGSDLKSW